MRLQVGPDRGGRPLLPPIVLGDSHRHQLATAIEQRLEVARLLVGQVAGLRPDRLGVVGQDTGVDGVGLRMLADRAGKVADPARLDDPDRHSGLGEGHDRRPLQPAGRLKQDQGRGRRLEPTNERGDPLGAVGQAEFLAIGPRGDVEMGLGDIDADESEHGFHERSPGFRRTTSRHGPALPIRFDPGDCSGSSPGETATTTKLSHGL